LAVIKTAEIIMMIAGVDQAMVTAVRVTDMVMVARVMVTEAQAMVMEARATVTGLRAMVTAARAMVTVLRVMAMEAGILVTVLQVKAGQVHLRLCLRNRIKASLTAPVFGAAYQPGKLRAPVDFQLIPQPWPPVFLAVASD
jgi:hypothetical protein